MKRRFHPFTLTPTDNMSEQIDELTKKVTGLETGFQNLTNEVSGMRGDIRELTAAIRERYIPTPESAANPAAKPAEVAGEQPAGGSPEAAPANPGATGTGQHRGTTSPARIRIPSARE